MRLWLVDPSKMCRKHLLGEHVECHMFVGCINKGVSLNGYINKGLVNTGLIKNRHNELVKEMKKRGMNHKSQLPSFNIPILGYVDVKGNEKELAKRCCECKFRDDKK